MTQPPLRIEKRLSYLPGNPGSGIEAHVIRTILRHTCADAFAHAVAAADRDGDAGAKSKVVGGFLGEAACNGAAGANGGELVRVQTETLEHVVIIVARLQVHQTRARGIRKIGRVHAACEPVNEIVLALQETDRFFVDLRLVFMQPDCLGKREVRREDIAGNAVEIVCAKPVQQRFGYGFCARVAPDHRRAQHLTLTVHRQKPQHMPGNADGVDLLEIFRHQLAQHQHRAHGAHPPVGGILLDPAVRSVMGGVGGGYVPEDVQMRIDQRRLQAARSDVEDQQNGMQRESLPVVYRDR